MDLTGKVIAILQPRSGQSQRTGNPWMSQEYVIEVPSGQYPRRMVFTVFGEDRIKMFNLQIGEDVTVQFDIDAHEYQGRWFNDIRAFNVFRGQPAQTVPAAGSIPGATAAPFPPAPGAAPAAPAYTPAPAAAPTQAAAPAAPFPPAQEGAEEGAADDLPF